MLAPKGAWSSPPHLQHQANLENGAHHDEHNEHSQQHIIQRQAPEPRRTLHIAGIDPFVDEKRILDIFSPYGVVEMISIKIPGSQHHRHRHHSVASGTKAQGTGTNSSTTASGGGAAVPTAVGSSPLRYGFVRMATREQAETALRAVPGVPQGPNLPPLRVDWGQMNTTLYVGNLPTGLTTEEFRDIFNRFGPIVEHETTVKHGQYGFVRYLRREDAKGAYDQMKGATIYGRRVRLGWGDEISQRCAVHVRFNSIDTPRITQAHLYNAFSNYGEVLRVTLPPPDHFAKLIKRGFDPNTETSFAIVYYPDDDVGELSVQNAIADMDGGHVNHVHITCSVAKRQSQQQQPSHPLPAAVGGRAPSPVPSPRNAAVSVSSSTAGHVAAALAAESHSGDYLSNNKSSSSSAVPQPLPIHMTTTASERLHSHSLQYTTSPRAPTSPRPRASSYGNLAGSAGSIRSAHPPPSVTDIHFVLSRGAEAKLVRTYRDADDDVYLYELKVPRTRSRRSSTLGSRGDLASPQVMHSAVALPTPDASKGARASPRHAGSGGRFFGSAHNTSGEEPTSPSRPRATSATVASFNVSAASPAAAASEEHQASGGSDSNLLKSASTTSAIHRAPVQRITT